MRRATLLAALALLAVSVVDAAAARQTPQVFRDPQRIRPEKTAGQTPAPPTIVGASFWPNEWLLHGSFNVVLSGMGDAALDGWVRFEGEGSQCGLTDRSDGVLSPPQPDGTQVVSIPGMLIPSRWPVAHRALVASQRCEVKLTIPLRRPGGQPFNVEGHVGFDVRPHQEVKITDTARLRDWLKVDQGPLGCQTDDSGGKLGVRVTATPTGANCRADFMSIRTASDFNANRLPEGVILESTNWKLDGDRGQCALCADPRRPCLALPRRLLPSPTRNTSPARS